MKKLYNVSEEEKNRIRGLHESFKNKNNLISEQDNKTDFDEAKFKEESKKLIDLV